VRNPIHATGVGLLLYGKEAMQMRTHASNARLGLGGMLQKMRSWFQVNF
jgi:cell division protein FtsA